MGAYFNSIVERRVGADVRRICAVVRVACAVMRGVSPALNLTLPAPPGGD